MAITRQNAMVGWVILLFEVSPRRSNTDAKRQLDSAKKEPQSCLPIPLPLAVIQKTVLPGQGGSLGAVGSP